MKASMNIFHFREGVEIPNGERIQLSIIHAETATTISFFGKKEQGSRNLTLKDK
jgi:hypothetical protein